MSEYSRDELIAALRKLADEVGRSPTVQHLEQSDGYPPRRAFYDEFGSWNAAKEAAGLETYAQEGRKKTYTDAELLSILEDVAERVDGPVTRAVIQEADEAPSWETFKRHFGSWNKAKEAAGLEPIPKERPRRKYSDEELLAALRELSRELGHSVTQQELEEAEEYPSYSTYKMRFESWNAAKELAGLATFSKGEGTRPVTYSDAELLQMLRDLADEVGEPVTMADLSQADEYPSVSTYRRRFGSWTKAKEKAGVE